MLLILEKEGYCFKIKTIDEYQISKNRIGTRVHQERVDINMGTHYFLEHVQKVEYLERSDQIMGIVINNYVYPHGIWMSKYVRGEVPGAVNCEKHENFVNSYIDMVSVFIPNNS